MRRKFPSQWSENLFCAAKSNLRRSSSSLNAKKIAVWQILQRPVPARRSHSDQSVLNTQKPLVTMAVERVGSHCRAPLSSCATLRRVHHSLRRLPWARHIDEALSCSLVEDDTHLLQALSGDTQRVPAVASAPVRVSLVLGITNGSSIAHYIRQSLFLS